MLHRLLVDERDLRRVELLGLAPRLAGLALDGADDVAPHLHRLGVVEREVGVERRIGVRVGVEVVQRRVRHLVEAVRRRHRVVGLAEVPLADLARAVAGLLEHAGQRPLGRRQPAALTGERHRRHAAADRQPSRHRRGAAGRAARLSVERQELQALGGQPIEVRRGRAAVLAAAVAAEIAPADVVGHEHDDVGLRSPGFGDHRRLLSLDQTAPTRTATLSARPVVRRRARRPRPGPAGCRTRRRLRSRTRAR